MLLVWLCQRQTPSFHHLDEVPMVRGGRGAMGGGGAGLQALTPLSVSSLQQGDRRVSCDPPPTEVTPPATAPQAVHAAE